jgi:hypothetical protein
VPSPQEATREPKQVPQAAPTTIAQPSKNQAPPMAQPVQQPVAPRTARAIHRTAPTYAPLVVAHESHEPAPIRVQLRWPSQYQGSVVYVDGFVPRHLASDLVSAEVELARTSEMIHKVELKQDDRVLCETTFASTALSSQEVFPCVR